MVLYNHGNRPDHDCIDYFNLRLAQNANLIFHPSGSDAIILYDNMSVSALDNVDTFAGEVLFERKSPTATMQEAIPCEQIDLRTPAKPEIPNAKDEKAEEALLISSLTTRLTFSKQINADCRFDQELCAAEEKKRRRPHVTQ